MEQSENSRIPAVLRKYESEILAEWMGQQVAPGARKGMIKEAELREQCREFLSLFRDTVLESGIEAVGEAGGDRLRTMLTDLSRERVRMGFSPSETATFVLSLKLPLFTFLRQESGNDTTGLATDVWAVTKAIDGLGLYTTEAYQRSREEVIARQQQEMLELSTPVVKLWEGVLALPLIGTLDSARTQVVMENLLQQIVNTGAGIAIIDITGVPMVDTLVAQHLLKTVAAARLMGADCIISGIRPQIAQTIVHLGVVLTDVVTKATLADALVLALQRTGSAIVKNTASHKTHGTHPDPQDGRVPAGHHPGGHARPSGHGAAGGPDGTYRPGARQGRSDRHLVARNGGFVYRPHAGQHRLHVAHPGRRDGSGGHAAFGGDHAGGVGTLAEGSANGAERRQGHEPAAQEPGTPGLGCR